MKLQKVKKSTEVTYILTAVDIARIVVNSMEIPEDNVKSVVFDVSNTMCNNELDMALTVEFSDITRLV